MRVLARLAVFVVVLVVAASIAAAAASARAPVAVSGGGGARGGDPVAAYILSVASGLRRRGLVEEASLLTGLAEQHRYGEAFRLILRFLGTPLGNASRDGGGDIDYSWIIEEARNMAGRGKPGAAQQDNHPRIVIARLRDALRWDNASTATPIRGEAAEGLGDRHRGGQEAAPHPPLHSLIEKLRPQYMARHIIERHSHGNTTARRTPGPPQPTPRPENKHTGLPVEPPRLKGW